MNQTKVKLYDVFKFNFTFLKITFKVRFLIELGHSVNVRSRHGRTPLMSCALVEEESWGVGLARLLLEKGASLQLIDKHGLNATQYACIYEKPGLVKTFIRAADFNLNHRDRFGNTALHYSVTNGNINITEMITNSLLRYKQSVDVKNMVGVTPLLQAWRSGNVDCARLLIELGNADQGVCDRRVNKCSRDYEIELLAEANAMSQKTLESVSSEGCDFSLPRYMRPKTGIKTRYKRSQSAPPGGHLDRRQNTCPKPRIKSAYAHENNSERNIIEKEDISLRLYKDAGHSNPRNKPEFVFKSTPRQCFVTDNISSSHRNRHRLTDSLTAMLAVDTHNYVGWKSEVKTLLNSYDFQWTDSYRKSIILRPESPPSVTGEEDDELFDLRPSSPIDHHSRKHLGLKNLQHALGAYDGAGKGAGSRRSSLISVGGRSSRRGSLASVTSVMLSDAPSTSSSESMTKKKSRTRSFRSGQGDTKKSS